MLGARQRDVHETMALLNPDFALERPGQRVRQRTATALDALRFVALPENL